MSITFNNTWIASIVAPCDQLSAQNMFYLLFSSCFFPVECVFILLYDLIEAWQQVKRTTKMIESLGKMNHDSWISKKKSRSWTAHLYWIAKQLPRLEKGSALYCHGWLARNPLSSRNVIAFLLDLPYENVRESPTSPSEPTTSLTNSTTTPG